MAIPPTTGLRETRRCSPTIPMLLAASQQPVPDRVRSTTASVTIAGAGATRPPVRQAATCPLQACAEKPFTPERPRVAGNYRPCTSAGSTELRPANSRPGDFFAAAPSRLMGSRHCRRPVGSTRIVQARHRRSTAGVFPHRRERAHSGLISSVNRTVGRRLLNGSRRNRQSARSRCIVRGSHRNKTADADPHRRGAEALPRSASTARARRVSDPGAAEIANRPWPWRSR